MKRARRSGGAFALILVTAGLSALVATALFYGSVAIVVDAFVATLGTLFGF
jgi:hypothetical protein